MRYKEVIETIADAQHIVVIQAENPDGDSLASALALEFILGELGKDVSLYCPVQIPRHLRYLPGWDRVEEELPGSFDASIIVDTSSASLMERVFSHNQLPKLRAKPTIVLDHHTNDIDLPYQTTNILESDAAATGEIIYRLAKEANWSIPLEAAEFITISIMSDTLGLTTDSVKSATLRVVAELLDLGVSLAKLDAARRKMNGKSVDLVRYKALLMARIDYSLELGLAEITIPWDEIEKFSDQYNPSVLVIDEMRMTEEVEIAIAYKTYPDGKLTAKIRANFGADYADTLAEHFGGGGHPYAAGFKVRKQDIEDVKKQVRQFLAERRNNEAS